MYQFAEVEESYKQELETFQKRYPVAPVVETPLTVNLNKMRAALDDANQDLKLANLDERKRSEISMAISDAARSELKVLLENERDRLAADLALEAKSYQRQQELNAGAVEREARAAALRFSGMTPAELLNAAQGIINEKKPVNPAVIDSLSSELRAVDPEQHAKFRESVNREQLYDGYRFTDSGSRIIKQLTAMESALKNGNEYGQPLLVPILHADGSIIPEQLTDILGMV